MCDAEKTARQVKHRYNCELRPDIARSEWEPEEDMRLVEFLNANGKDWEAAKPLFPGRTLNQIKNRYYLKLRKLNETKLMRQELHQASS